MTEKRCRHGWVDVGQCEACATEARLEEVLASNKKAKAIVAEQATDDGLWFEAMTAPEAYLQSELRRLHAAIETIPKAASPQKKTVYVVMVEDRHNDTEEHIFSILDMAMACAREYMDSCGDSAQYVDAEDATMSDEELEAAGWLFYSCYSTEGDCVWVLEQEVQ